MEIEVQMFVRGLKIKATLVRLSERSLEFEVTRSNGLPCEPAFTESCYNRNNVRWEIEEKLLDRRLALS